MSIMFVVLVGLEIGLFVLASTGCLKRQGRRSNNHWN